MIMEEKSIALGQTVVVNTDGPVHRSKETLDQVRPCSPQSSAGTSSALSSSPEPSSQTPQSTGASSSHPQPSSPPSESSQNARPQTTSGEHLVSLTLSAAEEEDSQLKSSAYSDDDEQDASSSPKCDSEPASSETTNNSVRFNALQDACLDSIEESKPALKSNVQQYQSLELRFLVRRREAGALIGKRGSNIKRLRETFRSSMFSIPDTGNGPERVVCVATNEQSIQPILNELASLLVEKSPENDEQIELKLLIHSSQAGSIIGMGGQSIKKLRNDSRAAIKIYELCCPFSNERVCAIKARPPVVVNTIKLIQSILRENPVKGTIKPYDALHFDLLLAEKYGGFLPDDEPSQLLHPHQHHQDHFFPPRRPTSMNQYANRQYHDPTKHHPLWRSSEFGDPYELSQHLLEMSEGIACQLDLRHHHALQQSMAAQLQSESQMSGPSISPSSSPQAQQQQHRSIRNSPPTNCEDSQQASAAPKSCTSTFQVGFKNPRLVQSLRYHPYAAPLVHGPALDDTCARPTVRHHPHLNHHYAPPHPLSSVYSPSGAELLYGGGHPTHHTHYRDDCSARMPAVFAGLQPNVRCRHAKPCFCMFMPMRPPSSPLTMHQPTSVSAAQLAHLARNFTDGRRNSANSVSSGTSNTEATKK